MTKTLPPISEAESRVMEILWTTPPQSPKDVAALRKLFGAIEKTR